MPDVTPTLMELPRNTRDLGELLKEYASRLDLLRRSL